jgi:hypothetical protein
MLPSALSLRSDSSSPRGLSHPTPHCLAVTCSRRHRHHLPGSKPATLVSPQALQVLHASKNTRDPLLTSSAANPALVDRRSTPSEHRSSKPYPEASGWLALTAAARKTTPAPSDLDRTAAYPFASARPSKPLDLGRPSTAPLRSAALGPYLFFLRNPLLFGKSC